MTGMIAVKEYTSAAEMRAAHAATRARLMDGPRKSFVPMIVRQKAAEPEPPTKSWDLPYDAHITAWRLWSYDRRIKSLEMSLRNREESIKRMVGDEGREDCPRVMAADVCKSVLAECAAKGLGEFKMADIIGGRRDRAVVKVRHLCVASVVKQCSHLSYPQIGRFFDRDHTSILWAARKHGVAR